jgi:hypothetical protein
MFPLDLTLLLVWIAVKTAANPARGEMLVVN